MSNVTPKEVQDLVDALAVGTYHPYMDPVTRKLFDTLRKLKLTKMPNNVTYGHALKVESLEATIKEARKFMSKKLEDK